MKNNLILIITCVMMISCSGSNNSSSTPSNDPSPTKGVVQEKTINVSNLVIGNIQVSEDEINLPEVTADNREISKRIILNNPSENPVPLQIVLEGDEGFKIKINRCGTVLAANAQCNLLISFNARGNYDGLYNGGLNINDTVLPLIAQITEIPDPSLTGSPILNVQFVELKNFSSADPLPYREVKIKNTGNGVGKNLSIMEMPSEYQIRINRCPENLKVNQECKMQILHKYHRSSNSAPARELNFNVTSPASQMVIKSLNSLTGAVADVDPTFTPVFSEFPSNTKEATCSGEITVSKTLLKCLNPLGTEMEVSKCSDFPVPTITYKSPEGEFITPNSITGGLLYFRCEEGSEIKTASRAVCNTPEYFLQANGISCAVDSYVGQYDAVANPVPHPCDGTQIVQRPLTTGSCIAQNNNQPIADSFCAPTQGQLFSSPEGIIPVPQPITNGVEYYSCLAGLSSKNETTSVVCNENFHDNGLNECVPNSLILTCTNEQGVSFDATNTLSPEIGEGYSCKVKTTYATISSASLSTSWADASTGNLFSSSSAINAENEITMSFGICGLNVGSRPGKIVAISSLGQTIEKDVTIKCPVNLWGSAALGNVSISGTTDVCGTGSGTCILQYKNLTINSGAVLRPLEPKKGMVIYVNGNLVLNGQISMTARGVGGDIGGNLSIRRIKSSNGTVTSGKSNVSLAGSSAFTNLENYSQALSTTNKGFEYIFTRAGRAGAVGSFPAYGQSGFQRSNSNTAGAGINAVQTAAVSRSLSSGGGGTGASAGGGSSYGYGGSGSHGSPFQGALEVGAELVPTLSEMMLMDLPLPVVTQLLMDLGGGKLDTTVTT